METEIPNLRSAYPKISPIDPETHRAGTAFNLHKKIGHWLANYESDGITLSRLASPASASKKNISKAKRKANHYKTNSTPHPISLVIGKKCIFGAHSRVDLRVDTQNYTLLLMKTSATSADWHFLDLLSDDVWPGTIVPFTQTVFTELLRHNY